MLHVMKIFWKILSRSQKRTLFLIVVMMVMGAVLETVSVSLVVPLISSAVEQEGAEENSMIKLVVHVLSIQNSRQLIIALLIVMIMLYVIKNLFILIEYYVQYEFIYNARFSTQKRAMSIYLNKPYEFFLDAKTGEILRVINDDITNSYNLLFELLTFFAELIVSSMVVTALLIIEPVMTITLGILLVITMVIINFVVKRYLNKAGNQYVFYTAERNKWLLQGMEAIKEIKVSNKELFFENQFSSAGYKQIHAEKRHGIISALPRLLIETVCMSGVLTVILIFILSGNDLNGILPQLSAFAIAITRLLPSANRISTILTSIPYKKPSVKKMIENLDSPIAHINGESNVCTGSEGFIRPDICLRNVSYRYPGTEQWVIDNLNMEIPYGKSVGLIGISGAGKTTIVDLILGLLKPQKGHISAGGKDILENYKGWLGCLNYIPQSIFMLDDTIRANVAFGCEEGLMDDNQVWKALEHAQLDKFVRDLPKGLDTPIGERGVRLSGGQRQRIGIARALYTNPDILIFDEATSALDNETESAVMDSVNFLHGKKTLIIIAHRLSTIKKCDMVYRIENGKIIKEKG